MRQIIESVVDRGSFFEMGRMFGRSVITGLARLNGHPVALLSNDPYFHAGALTADSCQKMVRFLDMAETFHLPVVQLFDCPGFLIGLDSEKAATIRYGARALAALNQTTVPWATVIVRNAYGVGAAANAPSGRLAVRYAWVSGRWGSLPLEGGVSAAYSAEIALAEDPVAELKKIEDRLRRLRSPFRTAEAFGIEELIDPRETRRLLCDFAEMARPLLSPQPGPQRMRP
jgi:acetyl-CoA carboxylase carboxyltransferase component